MAKKKDAPEKKSSRKEAEVEGHKKKEASEKKVGRKEADVEGHLGRKGVSHKAVNRRGNDPDGRVH